MKRATSRKWVISLPMIWLLIFFLLPFLFLFGLSFSLPAMARPPYEAIFLWGEGFFPKINAYADNWLRIVTKPVYLETYLSSLWIAFCSTFFALIIGFPMAFMIARAKDNLQGQLLVLVILPFWTSFLLRVYALKTIFYNQGPINGFLQWIGLVDAPIQFLNTDFMVYLGIAYTYLPFMVLPLYANLVKLQNEVLEASADLGATPFWTFWQVIVPLAMPGIIAGSLLVFIPAVGEFVIPDMLGGPETKMIGKRIYVEYFNNRDWPTAAALSIAMLVLVVAPFLILRKWQERVEARNA